MKKDIIIHKSYPLMDVLILPNGEIEVDFLNVYKDEKKKFIEKCKIEEQKEKKEKLESKKVYTPEVILKPFEYIPTPKYVKEPTKKSTLHKKAIINPQKEKKSLNILKEYYMK